MTLLDGYHLTQIKAFCDQYYIGLPNSPSDNAVLVYDNEATQWQAGNVYLPIFCAYDHTGGLNIGTSTTDLTYDTEVQKNDDYTHTEGNAGITVNNSGLYFISAEMTLDTSAGSTNSHSNFWLAKNGTEIEGTRTSIYTFQSGARGSCTINRILNLAANDIIKPQGQLSASGNTVSTVADSSRVTLIKLSSDSGGSGGSGGLTATPMGFGGFYILTYP